MFIVVLFTTVKTWKRTKCPSADVVCTHTHTHTHNGILQGICSIPCSNLVVPRGNDGGRDSEGVWHGHGHTAGFNMENQQGPAVQHKELCSILCNNLMVPRGKEKGKG